jgi:hypothetical protein
MSQLETPAGVFAGVAVEVNESGKGSRAAQNVLRRCFSFPVMLGGLLVSAVFCAARVGIEDPDTWWHIETGRRILSGAWPSADPFSFTVAGKPWLPYEWFGDVVMALCARVGGLRGLTGGVFLFTSALFLLLYYYAFLRCGNAKASFLSCACLLPLAVVFFAFRPQLIGYVFFALTLVLLERYRQGLQKSLWALPVVFLVWVNTHGSFIFGLFALGLYVVCGLANFRAGDLETERWRPRQLRHLALISALCVLALAATPYGIRVAINPIQMALAQPVNIANIKEWQPMPFGMWRGKMFLMVVLAIFLAQVAYRTRYRAAELALFLFGVYAACVHARFLVIFVIVAAPLLATLLARWTPAYNPAKDRPILNAAMLALMVAALVSMYPTHRELEQTASQFFPVTAVRYLAAHPAPQPMLNDYGFGGYLIWISGGQHKVFIDGRADIYEARGVLSDYLAIMRLDPQTLPLLGKYNIQSCLIQRDAPLGTLLATQPGWSRVYRDDISELYVRAPEAESPAASADKSADVNTARRGNALRADMSVGRSTWGIE